MRPLACALLLALAGPAAAAEVSLATPKKADGALDAQLRKEVAAAKKKGLRPYVELSADWCKPCVAIKRYLSDPLMVDAFDGVHLIRLDIDDWDQASIDRAGLRTPGIPFFFELGPTGKPTGRKISSSVWGEDIPKNMAPPLKAFFNQK